jgi:hypothetical protein
MIVPIKCAISGYSGNRFIPDQAKLSMKGAFKEIINAIFRQFGSFGGLDPSLGCKLPMEKWSEGECMSLMSDSLPSPCR